MSCMKTKSFNKTLTLLLGGQFISQIGDKFYALALAFWVLRATGSPMQMGFMLFSSMLPAVVLGFFTGGVVDRYNRKRILVAADVFRGVVVAAVIAIYYSGRLSLASIVAAQVGLSAAAAFFNPAVLSVMPQIVGEDRLMKANSTSQLLYGAANILGPVLGGLAVSFLGYAFVFAFNALSFFASALCEGLMRVQTAPAAAANQERGRGSIPEGFRYIRERKKISTLLCVVAVIHFFVGSTQVVMPVLANSLPGDGARNLGYIETAFGFGIAAAALLLHGANFRGREESGVFGGIAAMGAATAAAGLLMFLGVGTVLAYMAVFLLMSAAIVMVSTNYTVILQKTVPNDMAGRVFGIVGSVGNFSLPISVLLFGCVINRNTIGYVSLLCGAAVLIVCIALAVRLPGRCKAQPRN